MPHTPIKPLLIATSVIAGLMYLGRLYKKRRPKPANKAGSDSVGSEIEAGSNSEQEVDEVREAEVVIAKDHGEEMRAYIWRNAEVLSGKR